MPRWYRWLDRPHNVDNYIFDPARPTLKLFALVYRDRDTLSKDSHLLSNSTNRRRVIRSILTSKPVIRTLEKTGLKGYVRDIHAWYKPDRRELLAGTRSATFSQEHYADYVQLNRVSDELPAVDSLLSDLREGDVFYDVGANIGVYTVFAAQELPIGSVISFEPTPFVAERLRSNLSLNDLRADVYEIALSDTNGQTSIAVPDLHGRRDGLQPP